MTYKDFDSGITFCPKTPTKIRSFISIFCEKPKCIPGNDPLICSIDEQHTSDIFLSPYYLWDMVPAALMSINDTNDRDSFSNPYTQPTSQPTKANSYTVFFPLRTMDSKRKRLRVIFAFFQRTYLSDGGVTETVATVEELSDLWKPGAMKGCPPLVINRFCSYV